MQSNNHSSDNQNYFLQGGGEMGQLIRSMAWSSIALGPPELWPVALKQSVSMMLSTTFPVLICWGEEYIQLYNDAFRPILGKTKHPQAMGLSARYTYAEIWDTIGPMFRGVMEGKAVGFPDFMVPLERNGYLEDCYFDFSYSPIRDEQGVVMGVLVICIETTDKVRAIEQLNLNQQNIRNMVLQAPVGMCIIKGQPLFVEEVNNLFLELIGKSREQFDSTPYWVVLAEAADYYSPITDQVLKTGVTFRAKEHEIMLIRHGREEIVHVDFVYEPIKGIGDSVDAIMIVAIDVTDKVMARREIEKSKAGLIEEKKYLESELEAGKQLQQQKDDFVGMASHELKTPLTSLSAILQVLNHKLNGNEDNFISGALLTAQGQVLKMSKLINSFLNISRLESGKIVFNKEKFIINELLREVVEEVLITAPAHSISLLQQDQVEVLADYDKIGSVITNLLSNAVKYSSNGSEIAVSCRLQDEQVVISVKDQGIGIKPENLPNLFERYYRVETNHTISGFGIGLYLSAEIVNRHSGEIWVESEYGKGSVFYFSLPISGR